jgi:hypothetical protein
MISELTTGVHYNRLYHVLSNESGFSTLLFLFHQSRVGYY